MGDAAKCVASCASVSVWPIMTFLQADINTDDKYFVPITLMWSFSSLKNLSKIGQCFLCEWILRKHYSAANSSKLEERLLLVLMFTAHSFKRLEKKII